MFLHISKLNSFLNHKHNLSLMQTPVYTIASNAGVEGAVIVGKLLESDNPDLGYDAAKGTLQTCSWSTLLFRYIN